MNVETFLVAFSSPTRVRVAMLLSGNELTLGDIVQKYQRIHDTPVYRATIYRAVEGLSEVGLAEKKYDNSRKRITYKLKCDKVIVDFASRTIVFGDRKNLL